MLALGWIPIFQSHTASLISIPILGGLIGWVINWTGVWMLYRPLEFVGLRIPGLARLTAMLPRRVREIPGVKHGGLGWQGILPSRSGKLGSIAVDTQISKIGTPAEFYEQLDVDELAEYIARELSDQVHELVDDLFARRYAELWADLPEESRETVHAAVREQLPDLARSVNREIGENIDQLVDVKLMVIRLLQDRPDLTNRLFHEVGRREFRFIINFGFVFGFLLGLPVVALVEVAPQWWVLPVAEMVIGAVTNAIGLWLIYEPVHPRRIGPWRWQGLFPRRQHEASAVYAEVIAHEIVTVAAIGHELMWGPRSDRTRELLRRTLEPVIDEQAGAARHVLELAHGGEHYARTRRQLAEEGSAMSLRPLADPEIGREQNEAIRALFTERMRALSSEDFAETMRAATREDEWLLIAHGAVFGLVGGLLHYVVFGV